MAEDVKTTPKGPTLIHPALAWPVVYGLTVFAGAWLYAVGGRDSFSPWWLLVMAPVLVWAGSSQARMVWPSDDFGHRQADDARSLVWVAAPSTAAWMVWSGHVGPERSWSVWGLLVLLGGVWFWALTARAPKRAAAAAVLRGALESADQDRRWRALLDATDCADILITGKREHRGGIVLTCEPDPTREKMATYEDFAARAPRISVRASSEARRAGAPLPPNAVRPEPGADDAQFLLNVTQRDVFRDSVPYVPAYSPGDICKAIDLGEYEDASRILLNVLAGSIKIVGMTGAGKTVVANNIIAGITGTANALVWVGATDKLIPLIFPWLRSWFDGTATAPVLDYVAGTSVHEVLRMLRAAYRLCCERNDRLADDSKMVATSREPAVFCVVEETSHAVEFMDTITTHDGQDVGVSDLLKMILQAGRSANVKCILLTQYGLNAGFGDRAPEMMRNLPIRICLKTTEAYDGYRTLPGLPATVNTNTIPLYTMYVQPSIDVARAVPGKAAELDGTASITTIAARHASWRPRGVEPESELGTDYLTRWMPERNERLAAAVRRAGLEWRVPPPSGAASPVAIAPNVGQTPDPGDEMQVNPGETLDPGPGGGVDTTEGWTEDDERAMRQMLGHDPEDPKRPFKLPDPTTGISRLRRLVDGMGAPKDADPEPPEVPPGEPEPEPEAEEGRPLPEALAAVVAWLDGLGEERVWVRSAEIAEGIGVEVDQLGLARFGLRSANLPRQFDAARRKGYQVADIRQAATRYRFGM